MNGIIIIVAALGLLSALVIVLMHNSLVNRRNQVKFAFACIDVQLKKRFDLIPNLVDTVKAYAAHERETFESVITARDVAGRAGSSWSDQEMLAMRSQQLLARAEAYPELRSNQNFLMLQRQLAECEEQIAAARRAYNGSVMDYQNALGMFPSSCVASLFAFKNMPSFEAAIAERGRTDVRF